MNRLPLDLRVRVLGALCEGSSIRATVRMTGVAKNTIVRLLVDVGGACDRYQYDNLRRLRPDRLQLDEVWCFCYAKERNIPKELRGSAGIGDMWTWTALDPDSKLMVTWHLGKRTTEDADAFTRDLASRVVSEQVQITTDGYSAYNWPIQRYFYHRADHGSEVKNYGRLPFEGPDTKYSPMVVTDVTRKPVWGVPDPDYITTAHVERNNLTIRTHMRRFTRLTNGFSKKVENLSHNLGLHYFYYNFVRKHQTLKTTPAIAAGVTKRFWTLQDVANLPDLMAGKAA